MPHLEFQRPAVLVLLLALPALAALWHRACRMAARIERLAAAEGKGAGPQNVLSGALRLGALAALVVGLAGPMVPAHTGPSAVRAPVVFVLDVSPSMVAADVRPSRLAAAQEAVGQLCELLPDARVALVVAGQDAAVVCPPTDDRAAFLALLSSARTDWAGRGTHLSPALALAGEVLRRDAGPGAVVLASDGEDHGDSPGAAAAELRRRGVLVHTLTVGSVEGYALEAIGAAPAGEQPGLTRAAPERMAAWAKAGGGHAWTVAPGRRVLPTAPQALLPARVRRAAALATGQATPLAFWLYVLAAALVVAEHALRL